MFIEIHILQNFAPSNLNRDDTGNPKDTEFGGVRRARISSQCIKRAIRSAPIFSIKTAAQNGDRTRWITRLLVTKLTAAGKPQDQAWEIAEDFANALNLGTETDKGTGLRRAKVVLFLSKEEIQKIADELITNWNAIVNTLTNGKSPELEKIAKIFVKAFKNRSTAPDIALFGRMLAEEPALSLDAACQMAHAISTHRVNMDLDFFTAKEEVTIDVEPGAAMMGVTAFNSACFYRYARVDWNQLLKNLDGDRALALKTIEGFLWAILRAVPTGKQNSFAAQNPPDFVLGVVRDDGESWSLANAFEKPVTVGRDGGYLTPSIAALDEYWGRLSKIYGDGNFFANVLAVDANPPLQNLVNAKANNNVGWVGCMMDRLPKE